MYWLAEFCIKRPVFATMLVMAMVVAGVVAFLDLRVDRFPQMDMPTVYVRTAYRGAAPDEVESEVTQVLEDAVATVAGIDELRSISSESSSLVILTFNINRDIDVAVQDVDEAVRGVRSRLPRDVDDPVIRKQDVDASPILTLAVSGPRDPRELYILAERHVKNVIESARGVGQVQIAGADERAVQVNIDASRLAAYGISILQVREALARQNAEVPGGRVDAGHREVVLRTLGRYSSPRDFEELVVATVNGTSVRLRDLGDVVDGQKERRNLARLDGTPAVVLQVQRQSGANTVEVIEAVKERLGTSREQLKGDVSVRVIQDQSRYILAAMHEVQWHLLAGSMLATIVVLLFMRSWRSTIIAAVAIPASIVSTFSVMWLLDFTLNNVTMLALVLMVGVVIDDAIVVLENVFRLIEEKGITPREAAILGTREIGPAVLATTLSLVIVFLPVSFLSSVTGRMLYQFGMTATVAILVSMLISFTLTPTMCARMLRTNGRQKGPGQAPPADVPRSRRGFYHWIEVGYLFSLKWSLRWRPVVLALSVGAVFVNWPLYKMIRQDYVPTNVDESEFEVSVTAKDGTSIAAMDATTKQIEAEIRSVSGVESALTTVGSRGLARVNNADVYVRLKDASLRTFSLSRLARSTLRLRPLEAFQGNFSQDQKKQEIRQRLRKFGDVQISIRNLTSLRTGPPGDIDFVITGPRLTELAEFSARLRDKVTPDKVTPDTGAADKTTADTTLGDAKPAGAAEAKVPGIVDADTTLKLEKPELLVRIDRKRAAALGIDVQEIAETLRVAVGGDDRVSRYRDGKLDDSYDVELRLVGVDRASPDSIAQLYVRARPQRAEASAGNGVTAREVSFPSGPSGSGDGTALVRLDNVVDFEFGVSPARIDRVDRQRMASVRANLAPGYALADRLEAMKQAARDLGIPPGFSTRVSGRGRELDRTFADFRWTFLISFVFMYIVLAAQYEHLVHPITILVSLPLAVPFGLFSLLLGGETLNLFSALGILVLFGVVKKASILQIDHTNQLRAKGLDRTTAIMQGNRDRLRPILMTTIAFVAGMLPLLVGTGPGAEERRSIAVLAVGGQTLSLLLTLLAVPVVYSYLDDVANLFWRRQQLAPDSLGRTA
ncbi:MAG: efflux RND transporter permease subunit [Planctomycetia bacterium]|nr:efflux RND transporter permease subunit [Planctomycetia bacterium]